MRFRLAGAPGEKYFMIKNKHNRKKMEPITDHLTVVEFLGDILEGARVNAHHMDDQINILIGVNAAIFLLAASHLEKELTLPFFILCFSSGLSILLGLMAIHPPRAWRKTGQEESLMYGKRISSLATADHYAKELDRAITNLKVVQEEYAIESYNIYKYYYLPKKRLFHLARQILIVGVGLATLFFIIHTVIVWQIK